MTTFAVVQAIVITALVLFSAVQAFRKLAPRTAKRLQSRVSAALDQPSRSRVARRLGRVLQPTEAQAGGCGSGDGCGCGSCSGCAPAKPGLTTDASVQPLHFRPREKS